MFKSALVIFILGCIILVRGFGLSDGRKIPSSDIDSNEISAARDKNCLENIAALCVEIEPYPHDELKNIINSNYDNYFANKIPITSDTKTDDLKMCESVVEYIKPKLGYTAEDIPKLIINMGMNYTQEIKIEKCIHKNSTCNYVKNVDGYESYCKQAYTYQRLLSVDTSYTTVSFDLFKIPSGCICASRKL